MHKTKKTDHPVLFVFLESSSNFSKVYYCEDELMGMVFLLRSLKDLLGIPQEVLMGPPLF
jgi:hypothetical protein